MRAYERLLHYVTFDTASNASSATCPSTEKQLVLARALVEELAALGLRDARVDENDWVRDISINQALQKLGERERNIIRSRFFEGRTQMEVAGEIGISQAQVSRLEKSALAQMRRYI